MKIAVRSRYTNINGGYEESNSYQGAPAFRKTTRDMWIFRETRGARPCWYFGPTLPRPDSAVVQSMFASNADAPTPDAATWPSDKVERMWRPDDAGGRVAKAERAKLFVDPEFPHSRRSLGAIPALPGGAEPEWIPARHLRSGTWKLFDGGISPNDLLQGSVGDCWLVAAMACLAEFPESVEQLFSSPELAVNGSCVIQLYDMRCRRKQVRIDEFIPCHPRKWWDDEGMPLFARPNGNEAWVLLLEKAFAKMLGSYKDLSGGNCCTAFRAFTGENNVFVWARGEGERARIEGEWKKMMLADGETHFVFIPGTEPRCDADSLWSMMRSYDQQSFLVACSMRARTGREFVRIDGLVEEHAYSLLHIVEAEGQRLLFLRNPWGNDKRWNGRWSDGDQAWAQYPSLRRRLRPEFCDDGAFWIAWVDFQAIFDFVYVCPKTMRSLEATMEHARRSESGEMPAAPQRRTRNPRRKVAQALPERLPILEPGARVSLMEQDEDPCSSGRITEIVRWDGEEGFYDLRDVPPPYWTCPKCGEVNKRRRAACNVCSAARDEVAPDAGEPRYYRRRPQDVVLPPGTEVELEGLEHFPELNGQYGEVVAFDRSTGCYHIRLEDDIIRAVRPPRVIARRPPAEESDFSRWVAPAPDPSPVDEPEAPTEVPCEDDEEVRRLFEELDDEFRVRRDVDLDLGGRGNRQRLRRGQQAVREGGLRGLRAADIRRGGAVPTPARIRFSRRVGPTGRPGALDYLEALLQFEGALRELLSSESARRNLGPGNFSFWNIAAPGWTGPPAEAEEEPQASASTRGAAAREAKKKGWAGWFCPGCGHLNNGDQEFCENCEEEGDN